MAGKSLEEVRQELLQNPEFTKEYIEQTKQEAYQAGLDAALKALPGEKDSIGAAGYQLYREIGFNQAIAEAKSNIEKLKEPSNENL